MKVISLSYISLGLGIALASPAKAEISTDGSTDTILTPTNNGVRIENGDRARDNVFHSFREFSVPTGSEAFFNNASGVNNIFSRVTGGNISNIDGLIRANNANLFLINPAGIMFGAGARLDLGGSFYGSTADSILFPEGEFSATNIEKPVLTINAPIGLTFRDEPGAIVSESEVLQVSPSETLALFGGDLSFQGGIVTAPGGILELGSVRSESIIGFNATPEGLAMDYQGVQNFGNIQFNQGATLNSSGGIINIQGKDISLQDGSQITSLNTGSGDGGDIAIDGENLFLANEAKIFTATIGSGNGGDIKINTTEAIEITGTGFDQFQENFIRGSLEGNTTLATLQQGTGIFGLTSGTGQAGNITINTASLRMSNGALIFNPTFSEFTTGKGGDIRISASESVELIGSGLLSGSVLDSKAQAGATVIETKNLDIKDGGLIVNATFGSGNGGNITINATETIELVNTLAQAFIPTGILANSSLSTGKAGNVIITANNLVAERGAVINNNSGALILNQPNPGEVQPISGGDAGNIQITVSNLIEFTGIGSNNLTTSGISSTAFGDVASAGDITITTENLVIQDGARIDAATIGLGEGGEINIQARDSIIISGKSPIREPILVGELPSAIAATSGRFDIPVEARGKAGNLNIETRELIIQDEARIAVNSLSVGAAGNLTVVAESIILDNQGQINASTFSGEGGNITLEVDNTINLQNQSLISASAAKDANGGNITIDAEFIIAYPNQNSDITASADRGRGGDINITAKGVLGLEERSSNNIDNTNDIDASSDFGLDGNVSIIAPDAGTFQETIEAPVIIEQPTLGANACSVNQATNASSLIIKGKGGVPPQVNEPLSSNPILGTGGVISLNTEQPDTSPIERIKPVATARGEIYPARGLIVGENGDIILTAFPTDNIQRMPHSSPNCLKS